MATTNEKGTFENPFTITEFESMRTGGTWTGGWVTLSTGDVVYKTSDGTTEQAIGTNALGSQPNPFSLIAFQELSAKGFWQGGYVREANGNVHYYREDSECSICGSGSEFGSGATSSEGSGSANGSEIETNSGSGVGSGSGLNGYVTMGSKEIIRQESGGITAILQWGTGFTCGTPLASLGVHVSCNDPYVIYSNSLNASWASPNTAHVTGNLAYHRKEGTLLTINLLIDSDIPVP